MKLTDEGIEELTTKLKAAKKTNANEDLKLKKDELFNWRGSWVHGLVDIAESLLETINHYKEEKESWQRVARTLEEEKVALKEALKRLNQQCREDSEKRGVMTAQIDDEVSFKRKLDDENKNLKSQLARLTEERNKFIDEEIAEAEKGRDDIRLNAEMKNVYNGKIIALKDMKIFLNNQTTFR